MLAVHHMSKLGVPIYITETGVADVGDERRPLMLQSYMEQVERAVQMGYDLRGIMYWTLVDNFEWGFGFSMRVRWLVCGRHDIGGGGISGCCGCAARTGLGPRFPASALQFGVYKWENDGSQKREAHSSVSILQKWYERLPQRVTELLRLRRQQEADGGMAAPALAAA